MKTMDTLKFNTTIPEEGIIHIPDFEKLVKKNVEVTIVVKEDDSSAKNNINDFLKKWAGAFTTNEIDDARYNYLIEKYK
jgi:hypothetical protein